VSGRAPGLSEGHGAMDTGRTIDRPAQIYALVALWALKGFQELLSGVLGASFYIWARTSQGTLSGYALQLSIQSVVLSAALAAGNFYVMGALWLGRRSARGWGVVFALLAEISVLAYLITRPPEFGGDANIVRTVIIGSVVNLGIVAVLLFDPKLASFLGSARLVGWWAPKR
jgi:hypothetical protein